ncbi:hypothetical protein [Rhizobium sp. Leaf386]|uniref:hypothetical protein n=1 Tax=Rhizobium sp. Leaf386 TaxID=1736359 RepID=UPI0007159413|nr:hypothetical protein [Rhizobium sp. Leaf386]KQT04150.1 hypothetical protein ASG50_18295 [Rhizobium sp. Leaf386]
MTKVVLKRAEFLLGDSELHKFVFTYLASSNGVAAEITIHEPVKNDDVAHAERQARQKLNQFFLEYVPKSSA